MSKFFCFLAGPDGQEYYLNAEERKTVMAAGTPPHFSKLSLKGSNLYVNLYD